MASSTRRVKLPTPEEREHWRTVLRPFLTGAEGADGQVDGYCPVHEAGGKQAGHDPVRHPQLGDRRRGAALGEYGCEEESDRPDPRSGRLAGPDASTDRPRAAVLALGAGRARAPARRPTRGSRSPAERGAAPLHGERAAHLSRRFCVKVDVGSSGDGKLQRIRSTAWTELLRRLQAQGRRGRVEVEETRSRSTRTTAEDETARAGGTWWPSHAPR